MLTFPVAEPGSDPIREIGSMLSASGGRGGVTVRLTCLLAPLAVAVSVARVAPVTAVVVTGTDIENAPGGTVTVAGTLTAWESLARLTTTPPAGAGPCRFTQAVADAPPLTAAGVT